MKGIHTWLLSEGMSLHDQNLIAVLWLSEGCIKVGRGQIRTGQVGTCQVRTSQVRTRQVKLRQVKSSWDKQWGS